MSTDRRRTYFNLLRLEDMKWLGHISGSVSGAQSDIILGYYTIPDTGFIYCVSNEYIGSVDEFSIKMAYNYEYQAAQGYYTSDSYVFTLVLENGVAIAKFKQVITGASLDAPEEVLLDIFEVTDARP